MWPPAGTPAICPGRSRNVDRRSPLLIERWSLSLAIGVLSGLVDASIYAPIYRYGRISTACQRQQTTWGICALAASTIIGAVPDLIGSSEQSVVA